MTWHGARDWRHHAKDAFKRPACDLSLGQASDTARAMKNRYLALGTLCLLVSSVVATGCGESDNNVNVDPGEIAGAAGSAGAGQSSVVGGSTAAAGSSAAAGSGAQGGSSAAAGSGAEGGSSAAAGSSAQGGSSAVAGATSNAGASSLAGSAAVAGTTSYR
jgi:hypothetical protein